MLQIIMMLLTLVAVLGLALAVLLRRQAEGVVVFCPEAERPVKMMKGVCRALDDDTVVGSRWECQRQCFSERERAARAAASAGSR